MDELVKYMQVVAASAPKTPLVYYHFVAKTGVNFDMFKFVEKCISNVPSFGGVKFTGFEIGMATQCIDAFGLIIFFLSIIIVI